MATTSYNESDPCTLCHLIILFKNIYDLFFSLLIIASLVILTIAGVIYVVSADNPNLKAQAKTMITKTLTGFGIFLLSWLLVFTILKFISANTSFLGTGSNWFEFECSTDSHFKGQTGELYDLSTTPESTPTVPVTAITPGDGTYYTFQPGIAPQINDASPELIDFLSCMKDKLPQAAKEISSISDSAGIDRCVLSYSHPPCAHSQYSCHYGGKTCRGDDVGETKSYAVDFGNEKYFNEIYYAAKDCNPGAYVLNEGNHIHVSIGNINGCNCN